MSVDNTPQHANTRRAFVTGATAAGLSAILASVPQAAAATSDPVKLVCAIRRRPDLSPAEFYDYWLHHHGPFAEKQVKRLGGNRYVQSHTNNSVLSNLIARPGRPGFRRCHRSLVPLARRAGQGARLAGRGAGQPPPR